MVEPNSEESHQRMTSAGNSIPGAKVLMRSKVTWLATLSKSSEINAAFPSSPAAMRETPSPHA
jgi:hypothetical protein